MENINKLHFKILACKMIAQIILVIPVLQVSMSVAIYFGYNPLLARFASLMLMAFPLILFVVVSYIVKRYYRNHRTIDFYDVNFKILKETVAFIIAIMASYVFFIMILVGIL